MSWMFRQQIFAASCVVALTQPRHRFGVHATRIYLSDHTKGLAFVINRLHVSVLSSGSLCI